MMKSKSSGATVLVLHALYNSPSVCTGIAEFPGVSLQRLYHLIFCVTVPFGEICMQTCKTALSLFVFQEIHVTLPRLMNQHICHDLEVGREQPPCLWGFLFLYPPALRLFLMCSSNLP